MIDGSQDAPAARPAPGGPQQRPTLDDLLDEIGEVAAHLSAISAAEGAAGNISVLVAGALEPGRRFPVERSVELPEVVPELAGRWLVVTGSGCRLRRIHRDPPASLAVLRVDPGGASARLFLATNAAFARPTIELNSHLAIHALRAGAADGGPGAIVHAHPLHLTYLSHLPDFAGSDEVSRRLRRWQAETVGFLPDGVGYVPFHPPGTTALREATLRALERHRIALWAKHGVIACASGSVSLAVDYVDYLEAAARYEVLDLALGRPARGLGPAELAAIATVFGVTLDPPA